MDELLAHWEFLVLAFTIGGGIAVWRIEAKSFARTVAEEFARNQQASEERHRALLEATTSLADQIRRAGEHSRREHEKLMEEISAENKAHSDIAVSLKGISTMIQMMTKKEK